jgi:hypothetical protein
MTPLSWKAISAFPNLHAITSSQLRSMQSSAACSTLNARILHATLCASNRCGIKHTAVAADAQRASSSSSTSSSSSSSSSTAHGDATTRPRAEGGATNEASATGEAKASNSKDPAGSTKLREAWRIAKGSESGSAGGVGEAGGGRGAQETLVRLANAFNVLTGEHHADGV